MTPRIVLSILFLALSFLTVSVPVAGAELSCPEIGGLGPLLEPGTVLVLGELHGTAEAPAFLADAACRALAGGRRVTVGLEVPVGEQERISTFLDSAGSAEDRARLLASGFWTDAYQDGRRSAAMAGLLERLRQLRRGDRPLSVVAFDRAEPPPRDRAMALELARRIAAAPPEEVFLVLTGNYHSRIVPGAPWDDGFEPMAYVLKGELGSRRLVTLDLSSTGGTFWACFGSSPEDCREAKSSAQGLEDGPRRVVFHQDLAGQHHHGYYHVGPITASLPAVKP